MNLRLKHVEDTDIPFLERSLNKEHVLKWYHDADEWLNEIKERNGEFRFLTHFVVMDGDKAIGFCQYYDTYDAQEEWYTVEKPGDIFSIDYFIGEEEYLGKGYGKAIVQALIEVMKKHHQFNTIVVQPERENAASNGVLLANGFTYDEEKEYYILHMHE